eukprot:gene6854-8221_t
MGASLAKQGGGSLFVFTALISINLAVLNALPLPLLDGGQFVLLLLEGRVTAVSVQGSRTIEAADLYVGPLETTLRPDEIATEAFFPALSPDAGVAFDEISRRHGDYALCGVGVVVRADEGGKVTSVRA